MALDPATELLGSGPAFPLRAAGTGLPDLELAQGVAAVEGAMRLLFRTEPGELPHDPPLGLNFERLKHRAMDERMRNEVFATTNASLVEGEPRIRDVESSVEFDNQRNVADIEVSYDLIAKQVDGNHLLNPNVDEENILLITEQ